MRTGLKYPFTNWMYLQDVIRRHHAAISSTECDEVIADEDFLVLKFTRQNGTIQIELELDLFPSAPLY